MIMLFKYGLDILMFLLQEEDRIEFAMMERIVTDPACHRIRRRERRSKLDLLLIPVLDVHGQEDAGENDATDGKDGDDDEEGERDAGGKDLTKSAIDRCVSSFKTKRRVWIMRRTAQKSMTNVSRRDSRYRGSI